MINTQQAAIRFIGAGDSGTALVELLRVSAQIGTDDVVELLDSNNVPLDFSSPLGTGMTVMVNDSPNVVVINGDADGNSLINDFDFGIIVDNVVGNSSVTGAYFLAADVIPDERIDARDAMLMQLYINGQCSSECLN